MIERLSETMKAALVGNKFLLIQLKTSFDMKKKSVSSDLSLSKVTKLIQIIKTSKLLVVAFFPLS